MSSGPSKKSGSLAGGLTVSILVVLFVAGIGFYQFVYYPTHLPTVTTSSATFTGKVVQVNITIGAASKTTNAYLPNPLKLVIGVNNSVVFYNGDSQSGGVAHTATARAGTLQHFDTGTLFFGTKSQQIILTAPGNYSYFCQIHPTTMQGTIIVVVGSGSSSTNASGSRSASTSSMTGTQSAGAPGAQLVLSLFFAESLVQLSGRRHIRAAQNTKPKRFGSKAKGLPIAVCYVRLIWLPG